MANQLIFEPVVDHPDIVSPSIIDVAAAHPEILVAEINPEFSDSAAFCENYGVDPNDGANCVIVEAKRGDTRTIVACLVPVGMRADLNGLVKKMFDARTVSFAPLEQVIAETQMEFGSITPVGLPPTWPILLDARIASRPRVIVGGGLRRSKLSVPGEVLARLANVRVVEGLGIVKQ